MRTTFGDVRRSRIPEALGITAADTARLAQFVEEAQRRLIIAGGESGWWGTWRRMVFRVDPANPLLTLPRGVDRIQDAAVCRRPVTIRNGFFEFLEAGVGTQPPAETLVPCATIELFDRGVVPLFFDLNPLGNPKTVRIYAANADDTTGRAILLQGLDAGGNRVRTLGPTGVQLPGERLELAQPFVESTYTWSVIDGVQKDLTAGDIRLYEVDTVTNNERLIGFMEPGETVADYRRYYIGPSALAACRTASDPADPAPTTAAVEAMCRLAAVPLQSDLDCLVIGNLDALKEECLAVRYGEMDSLDAQRLAEVKHRKAVRILNEELAHRLGRHRLDVWIARSGDERMEAHTAEVF